MDRVIRWGVIGCGDVVRKRVAAAIQQRKNCELIAACRRDESKLAEFCDQFNVQRAYSDFHDLLADDEIDAVYIATPVSEHLKQTVEAATAGKHVLVEKPMAMTVAECQQMVNACRSAKVKLAVAYYRRFYPIVDRIEQILQDELIGRPLSAHAVTATVGPMTPDFEGYWRLVPDRSGGGSIMDIGSHRINVFLHLFGSVTQVKAICEKSDAQLAEDSATFVMRFENRTLGTIDCHFGAGTDPDEFSILGTAGRIFVPKLNGSDLIVYRDGHFHEENHPPDDNLCAPLVQDFNEAIRNDRDPLVSGEEGMATNRVIELAYNDIHA